MMSRCLLQSLLVCALLASFYPVAATADDRSRGGQIVVVVEVPRPWYVPDVLIERKMRESLPKYRSIPGLRYKVYTLSSAGGDFGGIYLWQDRAAADAWFTPAWYRRVREERGVEAKVRIFEAEGVYERMRQTRQAEQGDDAVATLVTLPGVHDRSGWIAQSLRERRAPGLLRMYEIATTDGRQGRVSLWSDRQAAERWFDTDWHTRMRSIGQGSARIEWFDAPLLMKAQPAASGKKAAP
jgi:hypothetical protein